jgi:hypothetical protein
MLSHADHGYGCLDLRGVSDDGTTNSMECFTRENTAKTRTTRNQTEQKTVYNVGNFCLKMWRLMDKTYFSRVNICFREV